MSSPTSLRLRTLACTLVALGALVGCGKSPPAETADQFAARANAEIEKFGYESQHANWVQQNFITSDTEALAAQANERYLAYHSAAVATSRQYSGQAMSAESARILGRLLTGVRSTGTR